VRAQLSMNGLTRASTGTGLGAAQGPIRAEFGTVGGRVAGHPLPGGRGGVEVGRVSRLLARDPTLAPGEEAVEA
jgi:hypothetical protein